MTTPEVLSVLKKAGKPQTAAIYKRYGTGDNVFGRGHADWQGRRRSRRHELQDAGSRFLHRQGGQAGPDSRKLGSQILSASFGTLIL